ncbi:T9SS type B sorting domain-containing protein [Filimonas effusa]|uniref:T9SS type B sorting domain-containing protein n=2 Tax=Filimonas effusa TaxID=2508721 RepID=A0A4Q1D2P2_9BACT|nr:T9SS type B sorting domain-containing protein [Filimonas effusa]
MNSEASAQRTYANTVTIGNAAADHVTNAGNATNSSETSFATLNSYGGLLLGGGAYTGQLELRFPNPVSAGVTTYIRISSDQNLLNSLLGGSLGNLLGNVVGTLVLGNHYFNVQARNGATNVLGGSSTTPFTNNNLRLIQDANGYFYIAITPSATYDRVFIEDVTNAVLLGTSNTTNVYYAFYNNSTSANPCVQGFATSFDGQGITLDLLRLGNAGVTNAQNVIDNDTTNFSQLGLGALAVAGAISQDIYFENLSKADDEFHIKLQSSPALLNVGLANNITITTYNGTTQVSSQPLNTLLSLDLIGLLNNGQRITAVVRPGQEVNRVRVTFNSLLNANLTQVIRLFGAYRTAGRPTFTGAQSQNYTICTGGTVGLAATTTSGNEIRWYVDSTTATPLATTASGGIYTTPALNNTTVYYVAAAKIGCTYESERVPVTVTVRSIPQAPVVPPVQPICTGKTATFAVSNPEAGITYNWYAAATGGSPLGSGVSFITPVLTDSTTFYVEATNGTCTNTAGRLAVLVPVGQLPGAVVPSPLTRTICAGSTTTFTVQNPATGITYNWYDAPTGGNLMFTGTTFVTPQLAANTNYYVEGLNATGCTSASRTQVTVIVNPVPALPVLVNPVATINPGGTATFTVSNPVDSLTYNWYNTATGGTLQGSGRTFTTPVLNSSANYYVEAVTPGGCASTARAAATVNVQTDVVCGYATAQQTLLNGACVLCNVADAGNSIDNDYTNYATVNTTIGAGGFGQLLRFGNTYLAGDSVSLVLEVPGQILGAQLLGGISLETYSGNNPNGDLTTLNAPLVNVHLLGSGNTGKFKVTLPVTRSFDGVGITITGVSALSQVRIYTAQAFTPMPKLAPSSVLVRASSQQSPILNGVACVACTVLNPQRAVDADTTTFSTITATVGVLSGVGQLVQFPASFNAGDSVQFDLEVPDQVLGANILGGIQFETYTNGVANGNAVQASSSLVQLQLLGLGGSKFRLKFAANNSFNGVLVRINGTVAALNTLNVYDAAVFASSQNIVNICTGSSAVLTVSSPLGGDIRWYTTASGGTPVFTGSTYTTAPITANTTYYVESGRFGCVNPNRTVVNVVPNTIPDNSTLNVTAASICQGDSAKLWATAPVGRIFRWYTVSAGGTPVYVGDTLNTGALTATTTYYVESVNNGCASNGRTAVVVTVNNAPAGIAVIPPSATIGSGQTASFTASSGTANTTFNWYTQPTGGTAVFTGPAFVTPALTASTTYYLQATSAGNCTPASRIAVPVNVITGSGGPVPCDAATSQSTAVGGICIGCSVDSAALAVDGDAVTASRLHVIAGLTNAYVQQTLVFPFTGDAGDTVAVHVQLPVGLADVGLLSTVQIASYNGTTFNNDRTAATSNLIQLQLLNGSEAVLKFKPAQAFDRVEVRVNSGLATLLSELAIRYAQRVKASPTVTAVSASLCAGSPATLNATGNANTTFRWYSTPAGGTALFTGTTYTTPVLTDTTVYYAEAVSNTGCASALRTPFTVNVAEAPQAPAVNNPTVVCTGNAAALAVQSPSAGITYNWYATATGGTLIASGATFTTPALTRDTVFYVEAASTAAGCVSNTRTAANITVNAALPAPAVTNGNVTTCAGSTATLSIQSPQPGITYNWYTTATGGTVAGTGNSFTTPAITGTASFYVEAMGGSGSCVSPRTQVTVTAAQAPDAPVLTVQAPGAVISAGETATINATSTTPSATFSWYLQQTGGVAIATGASFTTPPLTVTTTYYVEASLAGSNCPSATRTAVTITVRPNVNLACDAATSQTNTTGGICALCSVTNPGGSVDTDTATAASLNIAVGIANAYSEQILRFGSSTAPGDTVIVALESPDALAAADILGAISIASMNGASVNSDELLLNNGLIKIQLLGAGNSGRFLARFVPQANFDGVRIRLTSGLVSALNTVNIYYATRQVAPPVITTAQPVNICSGATATLTATASPNATIQWFNTAVGGTAAGNGTSFTTQPLTNTTTYYVQAKRTSTDCPNFSRTQVTVIVNPAPDAPAVASASVAVCTGATAVLEVANPQTGLTYRWYDASGASAGTGVSITTPAITAATTYTVEAVNSSNCASSSRTTVNVTANAIPGNRTIANNGAVICSGSTVLNIENPETGVTYNWYNAATGGSIINTGVSYTTPVLTGTTVYYIEAISATGCSSGTRTMATVNVNPVLPPPTVASANVTSCAGTPVTLSVSNPQTGISYNWYTTATGGTPVFSGADYAIASPASATYYVEAASTTGCLSASRTTVTVTVNAQPAAPVLASASVAVCSGAAATLSVQDPQSGITYRWYDAATAGTLLFTGPGFTTPALTATTTYYVEATSGTGCTAAARTSGTVNVNPIPAIPVITGGNTTVCSGSVVTFNVQNPQSGITYRWYDAAAGGNLVFTGASFTTTPLTANTTYYVEAAGTAGCAASVRAVVTINVTAIPSAPVIAGAGAVCANTAVTLSVQNPQAGVIYNWYDAATAGNLLFTGTSITTPALTANTTYYVQAGSGTCASAGRTQVTVTVNARPDNPVISANGTTVCIGQSTTLTVQNAQTNLVYTWYSAGSGGTALATGSGFTTPALSSNASYYVEVSNGTCTNTTRTRVDVTAVQPPPAPVIAAGGTTICAGNATTLTIQSPQTGYTYNWYDAPAGGNLLFSGTSYTTNVLNSNTTFYVATALNTGCSSSSRTSVNVTVNTAPAAPTVTAANVSVCSGGAAALQVNNPVSGATYQWYTTASGGTAVFTGPNYTINNVTANMVYYVGTTSNLGCSSLTRASVNVTITTAPPAPSIANATPDVCAGSAVTLTATSTVPGATFNWYATATGTTVIATGASFSAGPITSDTSFYVAVTNAGSCVSATRAQATIALVRPLAAPTVTVDNTTPQSVTFRWNAVTGATGYQVTQDGGNTFIVPNGSGGLSHTISGLQPNQSVAIQVRALGALSCQTSPLSASVTGTATNPLGNSIYVPNIFTPNNDGRNDLFQVFGNNIRSVEMWIFSQWGHQLFYTQDRMGWNGMSGNKLQPVGVYIYVVKAILNDGTVVDKKGAVNLVR